MLSEKANVDVTTKAGAEYLRHDIEARTGESLSLNTVKRLLGILSYDSRPREITLYIIARYLGYNDWEQLQNSIQDKISDFNSPVEFIDLKELPADTVVIIKWNPEREIKLRHIKEEKYIILEAVNSKLQKGDVLSLSQIAVGFPFMAREVVREGKSLGNYTSARLEGVSSIEIK